MQLRIQETDTKLHVVFGRARGQTRTRTHAKLHTCIRTVCIHTRTLTYTCTNIPYMRYTHVPFTLHVQLCTHQSAPLSSWLQFRVAIIDFVMFSPARFRCPCNCYGMFMALPFKDGLKPEITQVVPGYGGQPFYQRPDEDTGPNRKKHIGPFLTEET